MPVSKKAYWKMKKKLQTKVENVFGTEKKRVGRTKEGLGALMYSSKKAIPAKINLKALEKLGITKKKIKEERWFKKLINRVHDEYIKYPADVPIRKKYATYLFDSLVQSELNVVNQNRMSNNEKLIKFRTFRNYIHEIIKKEHPSVASIITNKVQLEKP